MRMRILVSAVVVSAVLFGQEPAGEAPHIAFMTKFEEAVKADNYAQMKELVTKSVPLLDLGFFLYEAEYCSAVSNKSEEDKKYRLNILDKLATLVSQETKNRSLVDRVTWLKTLTPEQCAKKLELVENESQGEQAFTKAAKTTDKADYAAAAAKFEKAYPIAVALADAYWQVNLSLWLAQCAKNAEDDFGTAFYWKRAVENARDLKVGTKEVVEASTLLRGLATRKKMRDDLIDIAMPVEDARKKYTAAMEKIAADAANPLGGPGADSKPGGASGPGKGGPMPTALPPMPNKHTMRIEWVDADKPKYKEQVGRPVATANLRANSHWFLWYNTDVGAAASKSPLVPGEHKFKAEKGKLFFDPDGDGKAAEERLKIALGKPEVIVFKNREFQDGTKVDAHHVVQEQPRTFTINGVSLKLEAGGPESNIRLNWQGATAVSTKFDGFDITIYDDNCDGAFNGYGEDSMVISKAKTPTRSLPLSRYVYLGDLLFELKLDPNGQNMRFKPYDGPVALVEFKYVANTMPLFMILEGFNENAQFYFNLMECKDKPMWIPPGDYKFKNGYFGFGEGEKRETILVTNTRSGNVKVSEGQLNKVEMGGAKPPGFTFTWKAEQEKDKGKTLIRIKGKDIKVFGCAGEEYSYFYTGQFRPMVKMRSAKEGPNFYDKQMKASAQEDLADNKPWPDVVFFPKDLSVDKTTAGDVWVQLEGDYPKLGKITSTPEQVP